MLDTFRILFVRALLFSFLLLCAAATGDAQTQAVPIYLDPSQPLNVRVDDLVSRMTLEEKASQLVNQARAIPRLQVPAYDWWSEALHGVANAGTATVFPEPIGLAATFDSPLIHDMAVVISTEARAKHNQAVRAGRRDIMEGLDFWSPNINIFRDPRWGRGQETYGEDPFLTGRMGVAFVTGLQGEDEKYLRVVSTPKHFAVHSGPEPSRHTINVEVSKHDMEDTYLPAFRAAVTEGHAASVMCAYNRVNGEPACANTFLLKDQLRGAWKFNGYVVSDCDAIVDIFNGHHFTKSMAAAVAVAMKTGMDNECADFFTKATSDSDYGPYVDAVKQGLLSEKDIDVSLKRLFTARFRLGMFDPPEMVPYAQTPDSEIDSEAHRALALKAAQESIVLLKNDGTLPLSAEIKKITVVGPLAESIKVLHGNYSGTASRATSALDGIRQQFAAAQVSYTPGMNFLRTEDLIPTAVLSTEDGQPGLKGEYFSGTDFEGTPALVRVDKAIDLERFHPERSSIAPPPGMGDFSVRWTGFLTPDESGDYQVGNVGSMNRLWLDGKLIVDDFLLHDPKPTKATVPLEKGHRYAIKLEYGQGGTGIRLVWLRLVADPIAKAVALANDADVVVAVVGITSQLEGEEMKVDVPGFKGGDRTSLDLPKEEEDLLEALKGTGKPLVVVLMNGSALSVNWANEHANAILDAWYSGEEGGTAVAQTLAGVNNPAGRLPVTFYKGVEQLPAFEDYAMKNRTYRYFSGQPLYAFGYGLSYSKFTYSNLDLSARELSAGDALSVEVDIRNTSDRAGDEVAELYLHFPESAGRPIRALRGFTRLHLDAGQTRRVHFSLDARGLSEVNEKGDRIVAAGAYQVSVGGGQPGKGEVVGTSFTIRGEQKLPD
ncbi:MAG TPA: glycoside hydrolase family 3 C-terminal domain-containing protein [Terriglobales bacterium]|jgi:beta-glucosidase|nr:glycoside hydrolase family 3 C-terminal domain-containing protein [Terriglobales bacterium]